MSSVSKPFLGQLGGYRLYQLLKHRLPIPSKPLWSTVPPLTSSLSNLQHCQSSNNQALGWAPGFHEWVRHRLCVHLDKVSLRTELVTRQMRERQRQELAGVTLQSSYPNYVLKAQNKIHKQRKGYLSVHCMYMHMHVCLYVCFLVCAVICIYGCICIYMSMGIYCMCVYMCATIFVGGCMSISIFICIYIFSLYIRMCICEFEYVCLSMGA